MGKRFEGEAPTFEAMLMAYRMLGLVELLGSEGEATAYAARYPMGEVVEFNVLPGSYTAREISDLRTWAA